MDHFYKQIFLSSPHPYLILHADTLYTISDVNDCYLTATGITREEVIGKPLFEVFPDDPYDSSSTGVSDLHTSLDRVCRCGESDIMGIQKYDIPLRDGSGKFTVKYWSPVNTPIFNESGTIEFIIHSVEDVTEFILLQQANRGEQCISIPKERRSEPEVLKRAEDVKEINRKIKAREVELTKLQDETKQFYNTLCSSVFEAILILENDIIIDCNEMAAQLFETTKDKLVGLNILDLRYHFECRGNSFSYFLATASDGHTAMECSLFVGNNFNKTKFLDMTLSPFGTDTDKMILVARDITEKLEEDKLFKLQARQAQMGEMIAMIAHQWRQPLAIINAIAGQIRLKELMKEEGNPLLIENLIKIEQQCIHLSKTISDYRDLSSPNKEKEHVMLSQLVDHMVDLLDHSFKNSSVSVIKVISNNVEVVTFYNEVLQVLITLLKNSLDACEENKIAHCTIKITLDQDDEFGIITIHDNAGGISSDIINKLFTPYFTTKDKQQGTGLGLYMSKTIIEEHCQGRLEVSSEGHETIFTIKLPR
ncbi:MAG TPA: PAS domain-containing sensor histidine kinase [Sulfuricurvum sp.]|nr:PAS domain-containing sensor histidine kinase [Sulfuricurvum sp.]